jgi:hypothetical protein
VNQYYGFIEINLIKIGISIGALAGPLTFIGQKLNETSAEKKNTENEYKFRKYEFSAKSDSDKRKDVVAGGKAMDESVPCQSNSEQNVYG